MSTPPNELRSRGTSGRSTCCSRRGRLPGGRGCSRSFCSTAATRFIDDCTIALAYVVMALGLNIVVGFAGLLDLGYVAFFAIGALHDRLVRLGLLLEVGGGKGIHIRVERLRREAARASTQLPADPGRRGHRDARSRA